MAATVGIVKRIADYFRTGDPARDTLKQFGVEWKALPESDKEHLRSGIEDGTLTY